jgi:hypothetical protein
MSDYKAGETAKSTADIAKYIAAVAKAAPLYLADSPIINGRPSLGGLFSPRSGTSCKIAKRHCLQVGIPGLR